MRRIAQVTIALWAMAMLCASGIPAGAASTTIAFGVGGGPTIPAGFVGLTLETSWLTTASSATLQALPAAMAAPMSALGPSTLRLGGTSADYSTEFADTALVPTTPTWATDGLVTTADLRALGAVLTAPSAPWSLGLIVNLRYPNPALAAAEISAAKSIVGARLAPVSIGNEPDFFLFNKPTESISFDQYLARWRSVRSAVSKAVPSATFDAADIYDRFWLRQSGAAVHRGGYGPLAEYTYHYYPYTDCNKQPISASTLLSGGSFSNEVTLVASIRAALGAPKLPLSFDEYNSISCGSYSPVEHEFASALWGIRSMLVAAKVGVVSVGVQTNLSNCSSYTPLCWSSTPGTLTLQPLYFAMLLMRSLEGDTVVPITTTGPALPNTVGVFGLRLPGTPVRHGLVVVNGSSAPATVSLGTQSSMTVATTTTLSGPSLDASTGVALSAAVPCTTSCAASSIVVPADTAQLITLSS